VIQDKQQQFGLIMVLISAAGFAFLPTITRSLYVFSDFQPTDIAVWRFMIAVPLMWGLLRVMRGFSSKEASAKAPQRGRLLIMGILYAGAAMTAFIGLEIIPASTYVVLFFTYPAMVALLSVLIGKRLSAAAWLALALTLIGIALTVPDFGQLGGESMSGVLIALLNALIVALYFLFSERFLARSGSASGTAWILTGALLTLALVVPFQGLGLPTNTQTVLLLIALAVIGTVLPILTINYGIQLIGPARASIISSIEPLMAMVVALILLNETILPIQWVGALFIVAGVVILQLRPRWRKREVA